MVRMKPKVDSMGKTERYEIKTKNLLPSGVDEHSTLDSTELLIGELLYWDGVLTKLRYHFIVK